MNKKLNLYKNHITLFVGMALRALNLVVFFSFFILLFGCNSSYKLLRGSYKNDSLERRVIKNAKSKEQFAVSYKTIRPKNNKPYYWFKNGDIHMSVGNYEGLLINGAYTKFNVQGGILEKGWFKNGLKVNDWVVWHKNGRRATVATYKKGLKCGKYVVYDTLGTKVTKGRFKKNVKHGTWVNALKKDTLVYKKGVLKVKDTAVHKFFLFKYFSKNKENKQNRLQKKQAKVFKKS